MSFLPRTRVGVLWRAALACVLIIGFAAATTAVAGLLQVKQFVDIINAHNSIPTKNLTPPAPGAPETLLLIGVDHRFGEGSGPGNTDTMILVRLDDNSSTINMLSIPRDLGVNIPGYGFSKINAAYADGGRNGASLLIATIKQNLFPNLQVQHVMVTTFDGFAKLITSLGCVYSDVDHRYYNHSVGLLDPATDYSSIDIQPGYQKLCGDNGAANSALAFVRFRHNDSDLVRESRQQDFLRWAKSQFTSSQLLSERTKLEDEFAANVETDHNLHSVSAILDLFGLVYNADGSQLKSIPFPVSGYVDSPSVGDYITFSQTAAEAAYQTFITPTGAQSIRPRLPGTAGPKGKGRKGKHQRTVYQPAAGMVNAVGDGLSQAGHLGADPGLPVYYPTYIPDDYTYCFAFTTNCNEPTNPDSVYDNSYPRHYTINYDGHNYPSYVFTLVYGSSDYPDLGTGEYFTVQGTTWQDPPILRDPLVQVVNGRKLDEYWQAGELTLVAWHTKKAVYWISNTLQNDVPAAQMVSMAATFARASG